MNIYDTTWPVVEKYIKDSDEPVLILPIGSTEQHGPTGLIGTDFMTAQKIAEAVGEKMNVMVASPICYGMAEHHMAFAGTGSLKPTTYIALLNDIYDSYTLHGFKKIFIVNGHGGNIAPVLSSFSEFKSTGEEIFMRLINWWRMPEVREYEEEHFGDENGFHATVGEVSVTMFTHPKAFESIESQNFKAEPMQKDQDVFGAHEFRGIFPDGRMGSNPGLATQEHGEVLFHRAVDGICEIIHNS